jgi:hypothetical protein
MCVHVHIEMRVGPKEDGKQEVKERERARERERESIETWMEGGAEREKGNGEREAKTLIPETGMATPAPLKTGLG